MKLLVIVSSHITAGEILFDMLKKVRVDRHQVLEVTMLRAIFDHPDFAVAFNDLCFDFADLVVYKNANVFITTQNLFTSFDYTVWTKRISLSRESKGGLRLLP